MAGRARSTEAEGAAEVKEPAAKETAGAQQNEQQAAPNGGGELTEDVRPSRPAEGTAEGRRSATVNLPFMTAQFRAPDLHLPDRGQLAGAARDVRSLLVPSKRSALFYGALTATALVGAIEWPVAAAIGVGTALASRGAADPRPRRGTPGPQETPGETGAETAATGGANPTRRSFPRRR
jgi:hypothetical protein